MPRSAESSPRPGRAAPSSPATAPRLAIVVPTRDRWTALATTLGAIAELAAEAAPIEVVVIDDGSERLSPPPALPGLRLQWLRQPPAGPATARNRGIRASTARRILLLGDDTRPAPRCLARHAGASAGLQGPIAWDPRREITPLMRFLAPEGPQFWFRGLRDGDELPPTGILGANYSAPREWFEQEPFDERFDHAAFEDTELGWRFALRGWRSRFAASACCWHDHAYTTLDPFLERQRRAGRAARRAAAIHPALVWRALARPLAVYVAKRLGLAARGEPERTWERRCLAAYLSGALAPDGPVSGEPE